MPHFAFIPPPFASHVRALEALAGELVARGHRASWVQQAGVQALARDPRIGFEVVGQGSHPPGTLDRIGKRAARPGGPLGLSRVIADMAAGTDMLCREAPAALRELRVDAVVADEMEAAGALVAQALRLPFVSVACALPLNREPRVPLPVMPFGWAHDVAGEHRVRASTRVHDWMMRRHAQVMARHAQAFGLPVPRTLADLLSPLAQVSQTTAGFDFPRVAAPPQLHHVGPLRSVDADAPLAFPPDRPRRPGVPFAFVSLGTLQGGRFGLLRRIVRACASQGMQVLLAHCDGLDTAQAAALEAEGATWVTAFAPQAAAVAMADVVVTHAGLNTVMDALAAGKPVLAFPIAFDQPGVAARLVHHGAGLRLSHRLASVSSIASALRRLLDEPPFAVQARRLGDSVRSAGGVRRAADIVEAALQGRPVHAHAPAPDAPPRGAGVPCPAEPLEVAG